MHVGPGRLLDLDGARGHERRGGESGDRLGRDRAHAGREESGRRRSHHRCGSRRRGASDRGRLSGGARAGRTRPGARAGGMAEVQDRELAQQEEPSDWEDGGQRLARLVQLSLERGAPFAGPKVAADERSGPAAKALGDLAELDPDLLAGEHPRLRRLGERYPRAHEQRLDARHGRLHRLGDLLIGERIHLAQHQRRPLGLREALDVVDEEAELLALVDLVGRRRAVLGQVDVHRVDADRLDLPQVVEAAVARDPVQPRPHVDRAVIVEDRVERGREHLLEHVLGVLAGPEQVPAEGQQTGVVARDEHLERGAAPAPDQRHQALVGLQTEKRRAGMQADSSRVSKRRDFHPAHC